MTLSLRSWQMTARGITNADVSWVVTRSVRTAPSQTQSQPFASESGAMGASCSGTTGAQHRQPHVVVFGALGCSSRHVMH